MLYITLLLAAVVIGCAKTESLPGKLSQPSSGQLRAGAAETPSSEPESTTYIFTDSAGREVELPRNIERIAPSGPLAQIVLFTLCPDKLVGFASDISETQYDYIDRKYESLPVFGNFYADTLNLESVMVAAPQVVIDIGEKKSGNIDDLNSIQERTGIPTIFVHMEMDSMLTAYKTLGELTGETEQAQKLMDYISQTLTETTQKVNTIPETERVKVYYGQDDGLTAVVSGTVHTDVIDIAGGINVADVEASVRGGFAMISLEQLMIWNPDVVLFTPNSIYTTVETLAEWSGISAIKTGKFYQIPEGPYNWMGRPPSVNRIIGIKWLSNLIYPEVFKYDMIAETREFYSLFYHCSVTDAQINDLLSQSTYK